MTAGATASRHDLHARRGRSARRAGGFTLVEVLLATVLLAAGLALAFATLRAATATAQRGEELSQRSEQVRAVEGFLRRRIASALPMGFVVDQASGEQSLFIGEPDRIRFVADLPDYLGRGGPHLHDVRLVRTRVGQSLTVAFTVVASGQLVEERRPRPPETLVDDIRAVRFSYRGLGEDNRVGEWTQQWSQPGQLPLQVRIEIEGAEGVPWPTLVIALPQAGAGSQGVFQ